MLKNKKAFTLIEILVVIAVLIILIGTAVPRIKGMQDAGYVTKVKGELQTLQSAVENYYMTPPAGSSKTFPPTTIALAATFLTNDSPQIVSVPLNDPWVPGNITEFNYVLSANNKYYIITSVGPDGTYTTTIGIGSGGVVTKDVDDFCVTNGTGC